MAIQLCWHFLPYCHVHHVFYAVQNCLQISRCRCGDRSCRCSVETLNSTRTFDSNEIVLLWGNWSFINLSYKFKGLTSSFRVMVWKILSLGNFLYQSNLGEPGRRGDVSWLLRKELHYPCREWVCLIYCQIIAVAIGAFKPHWKGYRRYSWGSQGGLYS